MANFLQSIQTFIAGLEQTVPAVTKAVVPSIPNPMQVLQDTATGVQVGANAFGTGVTSSISTAITSAESKFATTITTTESTIYAELKQGAIWAVLIIILAIGVLGLVMGSGSSGDEVPIVVPA